jgi:hypothetical protein
LSLIGIEKIHCRRIAHGNSLTRGTELATLVNVSLERAMRLSPVVFAFALWHFRPFAAAGLRRLISLAMILP